MNTRTHYYYVEQNIDVTYGFTLSDYTNTKDFNQELENRLTEVIQNTFGTSMIEKTPLIDVYEHEYIDRDTNIPMKQTIIEIEFNNEMGISANDICIDYDNGYTQYLGREGYTTENYINIDAIDNVVAPVINEIITNFEFNVIEEVGYDNNIDENLDDLYEKAFDDVNDEY